MESLIKTCICCGKPLRGRSDKKFCDDHCRNSFNNQRNAPDSTYVRRITHALKKNRRLLKSLVDETGGSTRTSREELLEAGFQFRYFTHTSLNQDGGTYFHCYDYAYLPLPNDRVLVIRKQNPDPKQN